MTMALVYQKDSAVESNLKQILSTKGEGKMAIQCDKCGKIEIKRKFLISFLALVIISASFVSCNTNNQTNQSSQLTDTNPSNEKISAIIIDAASSIVSIAEQALSSSSN